jgi:hypothetical protein
MKNTFFVLLNLLIFCTLSAQKYTISGYVKDAQTGESAIGANVYIAELMQGTTTNTYGYYALHLPKGKYTLVVSYLGYKEYQKPINLTDNVKINVNLEPISYTAQTVEIVADKEDENTTDTKMGTTKLDIDKVKTLPAIFGEVDVMKTVQLLPGVQSAGEGNAGFYVRGGGPDQNLILLDEAVVYNASHLFGFFSVFNADAIKNVTMIKGGMPAQYGGRLASVLDIQMNDGNMKETKVSGGIGLIASRVTVQGPIKKDTASFIVSARRTYIGELAQPFIKETSPFKGSNYYFYDLNLKTNYILSDKNRLFVSGYFGRDVFTFNNKDDGFKMTTPWGNATLSARWNHLFNDKLFMNVTGIFSNYNFSVGITQDQFDFKLFSGITDFSVKSDFTYYPSILHNIKFGLHYTYHIFVPSNATAKAGEVEFDTGEIMKNYANDVALYIQDEWTISEKFKVNAGVRYSGFQHIGPFKRFIKNKSGLTTDTITYKRWENVKFYHGAEPRISVRYQLNNKSSVKAAFTKNYQYIHLASLSSVSLPTDIWVPSSDVVKPQIGKQYSIGYFRNFKDNTFETSVEVYYKDMKNQIAYKDGALPENTIGDNVDNSFTFGKGWSYGAEFFVKKRYGKFNGWLGYTLSYTKRQFDDINNGKWFYAKYDRRHDVSLTLSYDYSKKLTFGAIFIYATGNALTLPVARYFLNGYVVNEYGERNSYRMAPYHRLDLSVTLKGKEHKNYQSNWTFSVYNVYNRYNPYFIYFANKGNIYDGTLQIQAKQVSLFGIIPSITWNFKF